MTLPLKILDSKCGVARGETKLQCSGVPVDPIVSGQVKWIGPPSGESLTIVGHLKNKAKYDIDIGTKEFTLTIKDTNTTDVGDYTCEYIFDASIPFSLTEANIEGMMQSVYRVYW